MSFEANDMNTIHLGNYEEFFILYMDNELNVEQVKMVEEFLAAHPDLKAELDMLMSTKLPMEEFSLDKKELLAENMKLASVDEELLLYIDNELPADKKKTVEIELSSNKNYQSQHQVLLQTKLDPSEIIAYPNKKELYRRTEKVVVFRAWIKVAAAIVVVATAGILYFTNSSTNEITAGTQPTAGTTNPVQKKDTSKKDPSVSEPMDSGNSNQNQLAVIKPGQKEKRQSPVTDKIETKKEAPLQQNDMIAYNPEEVQEEKIDRPVVKTIETNKEEKGINETVAAVYTNNVTSSLANRTTIKGTPDKPGEPDRKGSVKGFLRKATRLIEKRIGVDPTNEDGALLIGAVAINLK